MGRDRGDGRPPEAPRALKVRWREEITARLAALEGETRRRCAEGIAERTLELPEIGRAQHLLACLSFGEELDTWVLVDRLLASGRTLYVPRADPGDRMLHVHPYPCPLETLSFGLRQPPRNAPEVPAEEIGSTIDAVLVLGLGFDRHRIRLGHGGGYFDRFFAAHPDLTRIGLAFQVQLVDRLPAEPHDIPMHVIVTEEETVR